MYLIYIFRIAPTDYSHWFLYAHLHQAHSDRFGDDKTLDLEPGVTVMVPAYQYHHDNDIYPEASEFRPERFENGAASVLTKRGCFLPFGDGPRICLGESPTIILICL